MQLEGKTALVTGGAVRLGRALCLALAGRGCRVVVQYRRSGPEAERLVAELEAGGVRGWAVPGALESQAACDRLIGAAEARAGQPLDVLVNNASVFRREPPDSWSEAGLLAMFWPNLFAPMLLTRAFAVRGAAGAVVNLLDCRVAGHDPSCIPYQLTKQALAEFTANAALAWAPAITVNAVAPGPILPPPGEGADYLEAHRGRVPLVSGGTPAAVADAVLYLLEADAVTGQVLYVDGGKHLGGADHG